MKKIRDLYAQNTILQFLTTYLFILLLSLLILGGGFTLAFRIVRQDSYTSYQTMLNHSVDIIDNEIKKLQTLALQMAQNAHVQAYAQYDSTSSDYIIEALRTKEDITYLLNFQNIEMVDSSYIYFRGKDRILFESSFYSPELFEKYLLGKGVSLDEWRREMMDLEQRKAHFQNMGEEIQYIYPFSSALWGENQGMLVFSLDNGFFNRLLSFEDSEENDNYLIQIYDENNRFLWSDGNLDEKNFRQKKELERIGDAKYMEIEGNNIFQAISPDSGWHYVLIIPRKAALQKLMFLERLVFALIGLAVLLGVTLSLYLSIRKGQPINQAMAAISSSGQHPGNIKNIGDAVKSILKNHEELLHEMEREKPLLQKAFFNDLVKGDFNTDDQIRLSASWADIQLNDMPYLLSSLELFSNNDNYSLDEQTLEESHIVMQLLENRLTELWEKRIWFYKRNYRTLVAIFFVEGDEKEIRKTIAEVRNWLLEEYRVETNWGISRMYTDYLIMWRAAEESFVALDNCSNSVSIVEYRYELENINEFYFPEMAREKLLEGILSGNREEIRAVLSILEEENCKIRTLNRSQFIKLNQKVIDVIRSFFKTEETNRDYTDWHIMRLNEVIMESQVSGEEYFRRLSQICDDVCRQNAAKTSQQKKMMIEEVKTYLQKHYSDSGLCLAQIGSIFKVSEGYLSSLFKEYAGVNFTDYLEDIRIKKACELLKEKNATVNAIAEAVGYNSAQVFRRAFKRVTGISPKEARK